MSVRPDALQRAVATLDEWFAAKPFFETEVVLWSVVIVAAIFDIVTTMVGLGIGLEEGNAVARAFMATYGTLGIGLLKLVALVFLVVAWWALDEADGKLVLAGFAVISILVVALNAMTLATV